MRSRYKSLFLYLFLGLFIPTGCQQPKPEEPDPVRRKSPIAVAKVLHEPSDTYVKIVYGQPYKRDRQIFGSLVPYDEVWRTGANEATEITTTNDFVFGGKELPAGTYTLFSIPRENDAWTIILNEKLGQWGAFDYDEAHDVMRVEVPSRTKDTVTEALAIQFTEVVDDSTNIVIEWDQTVVKVPVEFIPNSEMQS